MELTVERYRRLAQRIDAMAPDPDMAEEYNSALDDLVKLRLEAESEICSLEKLSGGKNLSGEILRCYYLTGLTLAATARTVGCSCRVASRLKADALAHMREVKT